MTIAQDPFHVIVVDDVRRFALYVWRYLSRCVGFGTGDISSDVDVCPFWNGGPVPLATPAGETQVWWVDTAGREDKGTWLEQLDKVLVRVGASGRCCFLVDVRWPRRPDGSRTGDVLEVLGELVDRGIKVSNGSTTQVLLVSSYHTAPRAFREGEPLRIHPKSPDTLERLWSRRLPSPSRRRSKPRALHLLVTGAGFELKDPAQKFLTLGTRFTDSVLEEVLLRCSLPGELGRQGRFCCPDKYSQQPEGSRLRNAAVRGDLDTFWDELLRLELEEPRRKRPQKGRPDKVQASRREYELREAFRRQFLSDDWGFLNQALDASGIPGLTAWLTTNYTRFADRAIDLRVAHAPRETWRIVSTSSEAERLLQELLHTSRQRSAKIDGARFLFKLHGDLAHLLTMAIAGHDKEIYSPLSLPITSLHPIYTAAEHYLKRRLEGAEDFVCWHVVGHGLRDELLVDLVRNVCQATSRAKHGFLIVDPYPAGPGEILRQALGIEAVQLPMKANEYLARIRIAGLPENPSDLPLWSQRVLPRLPGDSVRPSPPAR